MKLCDSLLAEFDRSLGREESFWGDYNLEMSSQSLRRFSADDWTDLKKVLFDRPPYWQERCADAVGFLDSADGVEVLVALLESPDMNTAAQAASGLDNLEVSLPASLGGRLKEILAYFPDSWSPYHADLQRLIDRLV